MRKIQKNPTTLHIFSVAPKALPSFSLKHFLWDKLQFILVSVVVFAVSYGILNYQAIFENVKYQWNVWQGVTLPVDQFLADEKPTADIIQAASGKSIPKLDIEIAPPDTRIIIPRILKNIPVIGVGSENLIARKWEELEKDIQEALKNGVVHYPGTSLPGEPGNAVFTGHSSYYAWDPGRFKDVFSLLHQVEMGDKIIIFHNQKKFVYEVFDISVVKPEQINVLAETQDERITLITCTPLGTNLKRLVVSAKRI